MARSSTKRSSKKKSAVSVNFKGVESKRKLLPEGDYPIKVAEVTKGVSSNDNDQLEFVFETYDCDQNGSKLWLYCQLTGNSLWKLRSVLECLGVEVPDDELDIDLEELVGLTMMGVVNHETYDGAKRAKLVDFFSDEESEEDGEEEEEDEPKSSKKSTKKSSKSSKKDEEEEDEDGEEEDEDGEEESADERKRRLRRERRAARKAGKDDDDGEEEEDEEPKASKKSTKKSSKKKDLISADDVQDMDEDGLEELIEEHELDVDLSKFKTLRKKAAAVIDALEDADLLEE